MTTKIEIELIKYLANKDTWVTSHELTAFLNVSVRTIRSVVKNANDNANTKIIISSNKGYRLVGSQKILETVLTDIFTDELNNSDRKQVILKELLIHKNGVKYFDLADKMYVSEQTILSDIAKLRKEISTYNLTISRKGSSVFLKGNENDIRHLFSDVVFQEVQEDMMSIQVLSKFFSRIDFVYIRKIILEEIERAGLIVVNDYKMMEIILHFCILLNRKDSDDESSNCIYKLEDKKSDVQYQCAIEIIKKCITEYNVSFTCEEINNIHSLLLISTRTKDEESRKTEIDLLVDQEIIAFVHKIIRKVYNEYYVDLNNEDFVESFALHLKGLTKNRNRKIRNPLLYEIKNIYPVVYEISVFIVNAIKEKYPSIIFNDDETSYIALHVGAQIENQTSNKIKTVIVNYKYLNLNSIILSKVENSFTNDLSIVGVISNTDEFNEIIASDNIDLIISTINFKEELDCEVVAVSVFINQDDISNIYDAITKIKSKRNKNNQLSLIQYFDGSFCYISEQPDSWEEVVERLCAQHKMLDETFYKRVLMREEISSTEYLNMAIAHPIECNEKQTFITVGVFRKPFKWNVNYIDIVFLLSVSRKDRENFLKILSELVKIFSSDDWKETRPTIDNYNKFIEFLENQQAIKNIKLISY